MPSASDRRRRRRRRAATPKRERRVDLERYRSIVDDWSAFVAAASRPEPTVARIQSAVVEPEELAERLRAQGFELRAVDGLRDFVQFTSEPKPASLTLEHWLGLIYIQQASTGVAAPALEPKPGERVLDLCSAPGGKTTHIAQLMGDRGCLVASEISEPRIRGLLGNVYRLGHTNVLVVASDGRTFPEGALFDRVLLDAPCSGEGTLRRRAGQPPNQSESFLRYVTGVQRALLARAVQLTRPGGVVLYVTCTFAPEENEAVVDEALARLPVELEPLRLPVPHAPGLTSFEGARFDERLSGAARIYPHHLDSGGLFLARLRRTEEPVHADAGWSRVPIAFPGQEVGEDVQELLRRGIEEVIGRHGIARSLDEVRWIMRGGRAWMHTVEEWPLEAWESGRWRPISLGLRAIEFDSRGRPRPTNDFLRWARASTASIELPADELRALLGGETLPAEMHRLGPVPLSHSGDVLGRGALTREGLKSEIPKARAQDLLRVLTDDA